MTDIGIPALILIALGLSADCFVVALSISIAHVKIPLYRIFYASLSFGIFQALMPFIGWLAGQTVVDLISDYDHWLAFILLSLIGGKMIWESLSSNDDKKNTDISKWPIVLFLSLATSIDALAVGLTFAFLKISILTSCIIIGLIAFCISCMGFFLGRKTSGIAGKRAGLVGGIILIAIGLRILLSHML